jgi:hypothetical protein
MWHTAARRARRAPRRASTAAALHAILREALPRAFSFRVALRSVADAALAYLALMASSDPLQGRMSFQLCYTAKPSVALRLVSYAWYRDILAACYGGTGARLRARLVVAYTCACKRRDLATVLADSIRGSASLLTRQSDGRRHLLVWQWRLAHPRGPQGDRFWPA